mgnify:CR=1 FL=1
MFINECDAAPLSNLDYGFDYSDYLEDGETIVDSFWEVSPSVTLSNEQNLEGICSVFVEVTTSGTLYAYNPYLYRP